MTQNSFATRVIAWHKRHGRHDLPWQRTDAVSTDAAVNAAGAYEIWLSEIMLQQTQVATVIPYYEKFLTTFPTVQALAAAPLDAVLALWSGLGYYSRARNLHKAAQVIVERHGGRMPADPALVEALPGVGRSTAAAICVFAYGGRHAILDGNVKRVLARYCGVQGFPGEAKVHTALWRKADTLLPVVNLSQKKSAQGMVAYTQGLMDLGAGICTRSRPQCERCPLNADCVAHLRGLTDTLPTPKPRKALPQRATVMLLMRSADEILLEKRVASGIWGGLWSLPEVGGVSEISAAAKRHGVSVLSRQALPAIAHGFTHFKLAIEPLLLEVKKSTRVARPPRAETSPSGQWFTLAEALAAGIPKPVRSILLSI